MSVLAILTAAALSVGQSAAAEVSVAGPQGPLRGTLQAREDRAGVAVLILPTVNHVLKSVASDDRAANIATYGDPNLPLADGVIDTIADFLAEHRRP